MEVALIDGDPTTARDVAAVDFDRWVAARGPALLRFAYLVTRDAEAAQDAVQEALSRALPRWDRVARTEDPDAYVRRMVVNAHVSWWRRFARRETPVDEVRLEPTDGDGARLVERDAVWSLCATLPTRQRAAVVLRFYEDRSHAEIAEILGCSESTVRSQVHRALAALRTRLESEV